MRIGHLTGEETYTVVPASLQAEIVDYIATHHAPSTESRLRACPDEQFFRWLRPLSWMQIRKS